MKNSAVDIACSSICRFLHKSGLTHQKFTVNAIQRDELVRCQYCVDVFVFVDETGFDRRNLHRKKGYSITGIPPVSHQLLVRENTSLLLHAYPSEG